MSLLDSLLGALAGNSADSRPGTPLADTLTSLLQQNGGLDGLMNKFSQGGLDEVFSSWVGLGQNQGISADQIQKILGSEQVAGLAKQLGVDPQAASGFLSEILPKVIDKLTPSGRIDPQANTGRGLADLLPALLQGFGGSSGRTA